MQRCAMQLAHGIAELVPVLVGKTTGAQPMLIKAADGTQHPQRQLVAGHLHREHRHRQAFVHRHMLGHVEREGGLAHGRTSGHDHQIAFLQSGGTRIEIAVTGGNTGDVGGILAMVELLDPLHDLGHHIIDGLKTNPAACADLRDLHHLRLRLIQQLLVFLATGIEGRIGNRRSDIHQPAHDRALAHDLGIALDVVGRGHALRQRGQIGQAAGAITILATFDRLIHRHHIGRTALLQQTQDVAPDAAMVITIEIGLDQHVADLVDGTVVDHQSAQHRLLGLDGMRRHLQLQQLGIDIGRLWHGGHGQLGSEDSEGGKPEKTVAKIRGRRILPPGAVPTGNKKACTPRAACRLVCQANNYLETSFKSGTYCALSPCTVTLI